MNLQSLSNYIVTVLIVAGLIVLMALGKVSVSDGLQPLLLLGGLHVGLSANTSTPTAAATPVESKSPIQ